MNVVLMILDIVSGYYNLSVFVYILGLEDKMPGFCMNGLEFFIYWKKKAPKFSKSIFFVYFPPFH